MIEADDPIPLSAIKLTDAYERVLDAVCEHPEILSEFDEHCLDLLSKSREEERKIQDPNAFDKELEEFWHRKKEANLFLREQLEARELVACTRDPITGETLQLSSNGWISNCWTDYIPPGIWSDYIVPDDYEAPGPNGTFIRGALRPVFFQRADFDRWFERNCISRAKKGRGRPVGSGSWEAADKQLLKKMKSLIKTHQAKSPENAASLVAADAKGINSSIKSKITRLAKRYRRWIRVGGA